jgi:hypothetical protein
VEGELALHHGEGHRAAHPDSDPDSDNPHAYADNPNAYAYDPYAQSDSHAYAPGCCPVRSGAVVLQHPGAELLRE